MASAVSVCLAVLVVATVVSAATYPTNYDNINVEEVLKNGRLRNKAINCLVSNNNSNCTPDVKQLKSILPDALKNGCASCNDKQQEGATKALMILIEDYPEDFKKLADKFDSKGDYIKKYKSDAVKAGIKV